MTGETMSLNSVSIPNSQFVLNQSTENHQITSDTAFLVDTVIRRHPAGSVKKVLDLGTGTGIIAFMLQKNFQNWQITGLDIQKGMIDLARQNLEIFKAEFPDCDINFAHQDLKKFRGNVYDLIVCNPPYYKLNQARLPVNPEKALSRHEVALTMQDIFLFFKTQTSPSAGLFILYPEFRHKELIRTINTNQLILINQDLVPDSRPINQVCLYEIVKC